MMQTKVERSVIGTAIMTVTADGKETQMAMIPFGGARYPRPIVTGTIGGITANIMSMKMGMTHGIALTT